MNKVLLSFFVLFVFCSTFSYAAYENTTRSLAAEQLFQYAKELYDRGDKSEASQIFARVLALNPKHPGALKHLRPQKMSKPINLSTNNALEIAPVIGQTNDFLKVASVENITGQGQLKTNAALEQHIEQVDQAIGMLQKDIVDLRAQLALDTQTTQDNYEQALSN